jgi:hypothetical protein
MGRCFHLKHAESADVVVGLKPAQMSCTAANPPPIPLAGSKLYTIFTSRSDNYGHTSRKAALLVVFIRMSYFRPQMQ